jgi:hypothetical protein
MSDPIAYTYEADMHCVPCALARFGPEPDRPWVREDAIDAEGNPVGAISPWDEWCDLRAPGRQVLACATCRSVVSEHVHESDDCDCDACTAMAEDAR